MKYTPGKDWNTITLGYPRRGYLEGGPVEDEELKIETPLGVAWVIVRLDADGHPVLRVEAGGNRSLSPETEAQVKSDPNGGVIVLRQKVIPP